MARSVLIGWSFLLSFLSPFVFPRTVTTDYERQLQSHTSRPSTADQFKELDSLTVIPPVEDDVLGTEVRKTDEPPCTQASDPYYPHGWLVNCTSRGIIATDNGWFPLNTTTLILDNNNISCLPSGAFSRLTSLRVLSIKACSVTSIQEDALKGLQQLEILDLQNNRLPLGKFSFPKGMFGHVPNLRHLFIAYNTKIVVGRVIIIIPTTVDECETNHSASYSDFIDIFSTLPKLQSLSIDTFSKLYLSTEWANLKALTSLTLSCGCVTTVPSAAFEGLKHMKLRALTLNGFYKPLEEFDEDLFENFTYLDTLIIDTCQIDNYKILNTLKHFVNRNMTTLKLHSTGIPQYSISPVVMFSDGMMNQTASDILTKICVSHFAWTESNLFGFTPGFFIQGSEEWKKCLKTLDVSKNQLGLATWKIVYFELSVLYALQELTVSSSLNTFLLHNSVDATYNLDPEQALTPRYTDIYSTDGVGRWLSFSEHKDEIQSTKIINEVLQSSKVYIYLPPHIRIVTISTTLRGYLFMLNITWILVNAQNLEELYFRDNHLEFHGPGRILGLDDLKLLDISGSIFFVDVDFFDYMPGLQNISLVSMRPQNFFELVPLNRLLRNMRQLRFLDISSNGFNFLPPEIFSSNPNLTQLILSGNRFSVIPFELSMAPNLQLLDLTRNAIFALSEAERTSLNTQISGVGRFTLRLKDNAIGCGCSEIGFLTWLQMTKIELDNYGNYSCSSENGDFIYTGEIISDIAAFYRPCKGSLWLLLSIVLALLMAMGFLAKYLVSRFRTALEAFFIRMFSRVFRPMAPEDYKTYVCIGYADDDIAFVRHILLRYLEDKLAVSTFIHQRDMKLGEYTDLQFFTAIRDSWRVLLVITPTFLHSYDMAHIVMKFASHSVSAVNQDRVFALVEESQLHNIPEYLHGVLDDSKIIVLQDLHNELDYEQKQKIKQCLRPS